VNLHAVASVNTGTETIMLDLVRSVLPSSLLYINTVW